jgi:hypothetical protein
MSDTTMFLKRQAETMRFYSPLVLRGTLYVGSAVTGIIVITLKDWKAHENNITSLDIKTLWATCLWIGLTNWLSFLSKAKADFDAKKEKKEKGDTQLKTLG